MSDPEAMVVIQVGGQEVLAHRNNTALFRFAGDLSCYNHIFVATNRVEGGYSGHYLFSSDQQYPHIVDFMMTEEYVVHDNLNEVAGCDQMAFDKAHYFDIRSESSFPEAWVDTPEELDDAHERGYN